MNIQQILEGLYDQYTFKAVFMAGSPGAGKSTIADRLFSHTGLKHVDVDRFWNLYFAKGRRVIDYARLHGHVEAQRGHYLEGRLGLIIDSTARRLERMQALKQQLEESFGYDTMMIYVYTDLATAQVRVRERGLRTGREIDSDTVEQYHNKVESNREYLQNMFGKNFIAIDNSGIPDLKPAIKQIQTWLDRAPQQPAARDWIERQQLSKKK